ncbi:MAG: hypothetical protein SH818_05285 [Saprospiraceae bacterium]|nr:hypothetical protein [Saprospiraceae bacterium]
MNWKKKVIPFLFSLTVCLIAQGQTYKAYVKAATEAAAAKDYYSALIYNLNALEFDSTKIDRLHGAAEAARYINSYKVAEQYYQKVINLDKNDTYPLDKFYLAEMRQRQGNYTQAKGDYQMYLTENTNENPYFTQKADKEIKACDWAITQVNQTMENIKINRLGDDINTPYSEFGAFRKGDSLFYSSLRFELPADQSYPKRTFSNLLLSVNGVASDALSGINNPLSHTAHTAISEKSGRMYFNLCEYTNAFDIRCDLYYRDWSNGAYGEVIKLPDPINLTGFTNTQPNLGVNYRTQEEVLYWVSDRTGGKGKLDIWFATLNSDGSFSAPQNLARVNTAENDITPFFHKPLQELYFSSEGYIGLGGFDVYKSILKNNTWDEPEHTGVPINSSFNDVYFTLSEDGHKGLMSSNRVGSAYLDALQEACCYDIYNIDLVPTDIELEVTVFDKNTLEALIGATVKLKNLTVPNTPDIVLTNPTANDFLFKLERNKDYLITAEKEKYRPDTVSLSTFGISRSQKMTRKVYLETDQIDLNVLTFDKKTQEALQGAEVTMIDQHDSSIVSKINLNGNDFNFPLIRGRQYRIIANKKGYNPSTLFLDTRPINANTITEKMFLDIGDIYSFLPLILFFDNDQPDIRSYKPRTDKLYSETYPPYYARKEEYKDQWASKLKQEEIPESDQTYETFFNDRLKKGNNDLSRFLDILIGMLNRGDKFEVFLRGYASPRASERYNLILGQRRIFSVKNEFLKYQNGVLANFLNNGQLRIAEKSFGETTAPRRVPDNIANQRLSIFSLDASQERRVEIVEVKPHK